MWALRTAQSPLGHLILAACRLRVEVREHHALCALVFDQIAQLFGRRGVGDIKGLGKRALVN